MTINPKWGFDPRPREESDSSFAIERIDRAIVSIRALAKRATRRAERVRKRVAVSIRALAKRATLFS